MNAMEILSLGGTYPGPPSTCRGTIENQSPSLRCGLKNLRRENGSLERFPQDFDLSFPTSAAVLRYFS